MPIPLRALIIEDVEEDAELLVYELRKGGYDVTYERVDTAPAMEAALLSQPWDIVFSDYHMLNFSGDAALKMFRSMGLEIPFILVSGQVTEDMAVDIVKSGADDFVLKGSWARLVPIVQRELLRRQARRERKLAEQEKKMVEIPALRRYLPLSIVIGCGFIFIVLFFFTISGWQKKYIQREFEILAVDRIQSIRQELGDIELALEFLRVHFNSRPEAMMGELTAFAGEFQTFVQNIYANQTEIIALALIPRLAEKDRVPFESAAFPISEFDSSGKMIRAAPRDFYFPVFAIEPTDGVLTLRGLDLSSIPLCSDAMGRAADLGRMVISGRMPLSFKLGGDFGLLLFMPMYRAGEPLNTISERRRNLLGFTVVLLNLQGLVDHAQDKFQLAGLDLQLEDQNAQGEERFLHYHPSRTRADRTGSKLPDSDILVRQQFVVGQRSWLVSAVPSPDFSASRSALLPWIVLIGGLLFSSISGLYLYHHLHQSLYVEKLVKDRSAKLSSEVLKREMIEKALLESNQTLRTLIQASPLAVISTDSRSIVRLWNPAAERLLGWKSPEVMGRALPPLNADDAEFYLKIIGKLQNSDEIITMEMRPRRKDGSAFDALASIAAQPGEHDENPNFIALIADISERKRMEEELRCARVELELRVVERTQELVGSRARLEHLLTVSPAVIYNLKIEDDWRVSFISANVTKLLGYEPEDFTSAAVRWADCIHPDDRERILSFRTILLEHDYHIQEYRFKHKDGKYRWMHDELRILRDADGLPSDLVGFWMDITTRKLMEDKLQQAKAELEKRVNERTIELTRTIQTLEQRATEMRLLSQMGEMLQAALTIDEAHQIVSRFIVQIFQGLSGGLYLFHANSNQFEAIAAWNKVGEPELTEFFIREECWALRRGQPHRLENQRDGLLCPHVKEADLPSLFASYCAPLIAQGEVMGVLHVQSRTPIPPNTIQLAQTVTEHIAVSLSNLNLREILRQQSIKDPLTNLFNRRYMEGLLARETQRAVRHKAPFSIIMLDIDFFKTFNDSHGHEAGDAVLSALGQYLLNHVRGEDIACRYGGEEFTLILPGASLEAGRQRAEQLRAGLQDVQIRFGATVLGPVTISMGVAVFPDHGQTWEAVLQMADAALYNAKQNGRNRVEVARDDILYNT